MPRYDIETVKSAAADRWPEIFRAVAGTDEQLFDGDHHPCPKCGGRDRFRLIDKSAGACLCNQCLATKNGDGFAVLQWLTGKDFAESLAEVAKHLGVKPEKSRKTADPAEHLEFMPWNRTLVHLWCMKKKPIKPDVVQAVGARLARYRGQYNVIAIPVWGSSLHESDPVGWVIYHTNGGHLPKWSKTGDPDWVKVKLTAGSKQGVICSTTTFADSQSELWKTEGPTDLMALLSASDAINGFTTSNGAQEKPLDWILKLCEDRPINVIHDADKPGQDGATVIPGRDGQDRPGWCPRLAEYAKEVRNVTLPFPIEPTHGQDLRDFFNGGSTLEDLFERHGLAEPWSSKPAPRLIDEHEDDPQRLARVNLERYKSDHDGRLVYWRDEWWKWKGGRYRKIEISELKAKVWAAVRAEFEACWRERSARGEDKPIKKVTRALVSNVIGAMESICSIPSSIPMPSWMPDRKARNYVAVENGILDLDAVFDGKPEDECLRPHSADWFSACKLGYEFDTDAECPKWLDYLDFCMDGDQERINLLQEWSGYLLRNSNDLQKFLVLEGEGGNGKTVYFAAMTAMLGEDNVSHVSIENFDGRFELGTTIGKYANISGDAGEIDSVAEGVLKQFTGGDIMQFDRKNQTPISARPTAKLMAAWNARPRIRDKSMGLWRRMLLVPFNRTIPQSRRVLGMDKPHWWIEQGEAPGILLWAIAGLHRLNKQGQFTQSQICDDAIEEYRADSNPALRFIDENVQLLPAELLAEEMQKDLTDQHGLPVDELYNRYREWCTGENIKPLAKANFGKQIKNRFGDLKHRRGSQGDRYFVYRLLCYTGEYF